MCEFSLTELLTYYSWSFTDGHLTEHPILKAFIKYDHN
jgi:hypothetical protein